MTSTPTTAPVPTQTTPSDSDPIVVFEGVSITFDIKPVLEDISFTVAPGETRVILGPAGCGKSVLMKLANGLLRPDTGVIRIFGRDITQMRETDLYPFRSRIGMVFQESALFDSLSVEDNVAYRLHEEKVPEAEAHTRVEEVLRFVDLEQAIAKFPSELSGGMRRRVSIARALVSRPQIVLYDSPTAGLDPVTSQTIITLILRLRDVYGVTALLATHRVQDGFALANFKFDPQSKRVVRDPASSSRVQANQDEPVTRFVVYNEGRIYFDGTPEEIASTKDPYLKRYLV
jgi:phospholipid/cholesterol/gamma-HCH transport system ATP-binding protein